MISGNKCQNCGKGIMYGHNVSHSKRRTRRIFKPNLHRAKVTVNGITRRMKLCTKCLRKFKKENIKIKAQDLGSNLKNSQDQLQAVASVQT